LIPAAKYNILSKVFWFCLCRAVVQKAMKDGTFDGSTADKLDASIDADEMETRR
jgi:hypothetical protein